MAKTQTRLCPLCSSAPADSREHAPPMWFLKEHDESLGFTVEINDEPIIQKKTGEVRWHNSVSKTTLPACEGCNNALDKRFEKSAKDLVRDLMHGRVTVLDDAAAEAFSLWALKTSLIVAHPDARDSDPTQDELRQRWNLDGIPGLYGWMTSGAAPPDHLSLWVSKVDPRGDVERYRAFIPPEARAFSADWSFLAAGRLAFDLVYDPTQTVEHPVDARGEAVRLWPLKNADSIDIGSLPYASLDVRWTLVPSGGDVRLLQKLLYP